MNKISISNFKAFAEEININLDGRKKLLLYGENGSGKSSLYEALRVAFFSNEIESKITANTPEDRAQKIQDYWEDFNNKITNQNFNIHINDIDYKNDFGIGGYQVFMISRDEYRIDNRINLQSLLESFSFNIPNISGLSRTNYQGIEEKVNEALKNFMETVQIQIDNEDDFAIKIKDANRNIERKDEIRKYFNEAKLNLIVLLNLLNTILLGQDSNKPNKVLILDDFITSLDAANRTFLVKYIFEHFSDHQMVVLTHNISFYNLVMYIVNDIKMAKGSWEFANLYEINNVHRIYLRSERDIAQKIEKEYKNINKNNQHEINQIGNRIRKRFEVLLYEYSKLLMIGAVEDTKKILEHIVNGKGGYFNNGKNSLDLIDEIKSILKEPDANNVIKRLNEKIDEYYDSLENFKKIIFDLKLYQKVTMHPASHGNIGITDFTNKEILKSIDLIKKMETYQKELVGSDVVNI